MQRTYCHLLFIALIIFSNNACAQKFFKGSIHFNDGKVLEGFVQPPVKFTTSKISFKASQDGEKQVYPSTDLKSVVIDDGSRKYQFDWGTYIEKLSFGREKESKPKWLIVLIKGPVTLYTAGQQIKVKSDRLVIQNTSAITYYAKRESEKTATDIGFYTPNTGGLNEDFRTQASKYFQDYPALVKKINDAKLKLNDITIVVEEYNAWVLSKKKKKNS